MLELRRAAWFAWVATLAGVAIPVWGLVPQMQGLMAQWPRFWWAIWLAMVAGLALSASLPIFLFALHRNEGALCISHGHRHLGRWAGWAGVALLILRLSRWLPALGVYRDGTLRLQRAADYVYFNSLGFAEVVLGAISSSTLAMLLLALARYDRAAEVRPTSSFLVSASRAAAIGWGLVVAGNVVRMAVLPYIYSTVRVQLALLPTPLTFMQMYGDPALLLCDFAVVFAAPYIVYSSRQAESPAPPT